MIQKQAYVKRPRWILLQIPSCPTEHLGAEVLQALHESYKNLMFLERETCQVFIHHDAWSTFLFFDGWNVSTALLIQILGFRQKEPNSQLVFIHQHIFLLMPTRQHGTGCFRSLFYNLGVFWVYLPYHWEARPVRLENSTSWSVTRIPIWMFFGFWLLDVPQHHAGLWADWCSQAQSGLGSGMDQTSRFSCTSIPLTVEAK